MIAIFNAATPRPDKIRMVPPPRRGTPRGDPYSSVSRQLRPALRGGFCFFWTLRLEIVDGSIQHESPHRRAGLPQAPIRIENFVKAKVLSAGRDAGVAVNHAHIVPQI